jgi:MFS family permease
MAISVLLILVGFSKVYYISAILLVITGLFNIWFSTTANSTLQINTKDEYRGRVMSVYSLVFAGATPLGNMFAGLTSEKFGAGASFILSGILTIIFIGLLLLLGRVKSNMRKV